MLLRWNESFLLESLSNFPPEFTLPCCRTYFGKEAEVAAHTHLDPRRVEKPKNYWMLVTGNPRNQLSTMLDLPTAPAEDTPPAEQAVGLTTQ
jgi:hypothetical protein